jgi:hypothetical protein
MSRGGLAVRCRERRVRASPEFKGIEPKQRLGARTDSELRKGALVRIALTDHHQTIVLPCGQGTTRDCYQISLVFSQDSALRQRCDDLVTNR